MTISSLLDKSGQFSSGVDVESTRFNMLIDSILKTSLQINPTYSDPVPQLAKQLLDTSSTKISMLAVVVGLLHSKKMQSHPYLAIHFLHSFKLNRSFYQANRQREKIVIDFSLWKHQQCKLNTVLRICLYLSV